VCIWNVNVRNVESEECGAVYVGIFSWRKEDLIFRVRKDKLWFSTFVWRRKKSIIVCRLCFKKTEYSVFCLRSLGFEVEKCSAKKGHLNLIYSDRRQMLLWCD
jgi:hypothetical protein